MLELDSRIPLSKGEIRNLSADRQISTGYRAIFGAMVDILDASLS